MFVGVGCLACARRPADQDDAGLRSAPTLFVFGGVGPCYIAGLARRLEIAQVIHGPAGRPRDNVICLSSLSFALRPAYLALVVIPFKYLLPDSPPSLVGVWRLGLALHDTRTAVMPRSTACSADGRSSS